MTDLNACVNVPYCFVFPGATIGTINCGGKTDTVLNLIVRLSSSRLERTDNALYKLVVLSLGLT
jgi:hypothetical protein